MGSLWVDSLGMGAFSTAQKAAIMRNPNSLPRFHGYEIDIMARGFVGNDSSLNSFITGKLNMGTDFIHTGTGQWWDMTTTNQWLGHLQRYGSGGIHLPTDPWGC
jgi:hypothetical protein